MARLLIAPELLFEQLFPDQIGLEMMGAFYDPHRSVLVLDIQGPSVPPNANEVVAFVTMERRTTRFEER